MFKTVRSSNRSIEIQDDVLPRKEIAELHYIDLEYGESIITLIQLSVLILLRNNQF